MASIEKTIDVEVPVRAAYNQWTQFEEFPRFMEGVKEVEQMSDDKLHWVAEVAGKKKEWDAKIIEQTPDQRVAWQAVEGTDNAGIVTFHKLDDNKTRVKLQLDYDPDGIVESTGDKLGFVGRRVQGDLDRFKEYIEASGHESGGWRGTINQN